MKVAESHFVHKKVQATYTILHNKFYGKKLELQTFV